MILYTTNKRILNMASNKKNTDRRYVQLNFIINDRVPHNRETKILAACYIFKDFLRKVLKISNRELLFTEKARSMHSDKTQSIALIWQEHVLAQIRNSLMTSI